MKYLLDTNIISFLYDPSREPYHSLILKEVDTLQSEDILQTSILVLYELGYSVANAPKNKQKNLGRMLREVRSMFEIIPLDVENYTLFGELKVSLKNSRRSTPQQMKRHNIDLMIASSAISEGCVLVSADKIYQELAGLVSGLEVENWTE